LEKWQSSGFDYLYELQPQHLLLLFWYLIQGVSQGKDEEEALSNIREAITGWLWTEDRKVMKNYSRNKKSYQPVMVSVQIMYWAPLVFCGIR